MCPKPVLFQAIAKVHLSSVIDIASCYIITYRNRPGNKILNCLNLILMNQLSVKLYKAGLRYA